MSNFPDKPNHVRDEHIAKLADLIADTQVCMLVTTDTVGGMVSRPMAVQQIEFDGDLWFISSEQSRKVAQVRDQAHVNVAFSSRDSWISVAGDAEVMRDVAKTKELWSSGVSAWFPEGPEDPNIVLVKVSAHSAEYWDTPGAGVASLLSFVKAKVAGESYDVDNKTVDL